MTKSPLAPYGSGAAHVLFLDPACRKQGERKTAKKEGNENDRGSPRTHLAAAAVADGGGEGGPPAAAAALKDQGNEQFKAGSYLKAAALYTQAIKLDPDNATLYRFLPLRPTPLPSRPCRW